MCFQYGWKSKLSNKVPLYQLDVIKSVYQQRNRFLRLELYRILYLQPPGQTYPLQPHLLPYFFWNYQNKEYAISENYIISGTPYCVTKFRCNIQILTWLIFLFNRTCRCETKSEEQYICKDCLIGPLGGTGSWIKCILLLL